MNLLTYSLNKINTKIFKNFEFLKEFHITFKFDFLSES